MIRVNFQKIISLFKHKHAWSVLHHARQGEVRQCLICNKVTTWMLDYSDMKVKCYDGNLLAPSLNDHSHSKYYVVCRNRDEFMDVQSQALKANAIERTSDMVWLNDTNKVRGIKYPALFFYGDWWETTVIKDPWFTEILNGNI